MGLPRTYWKTSPNSCSFQSLCDRIMWLSGLAGQENLLGSSKDIGTRASPETSSSFPARPPQLPSFLPLLSSQERASWTHLHMLVKITARAWNVDETGEGCIFGGPRAER